MQKLMQNWFFLYFFLFPISVSAQKKYALLIGIDKYYSKPGVLHGSMLRGCVNDAAAIKGMLIKRFGFENADITMLTNEAAGRKNVDGAINAILQKVKAGDAFVFYFSGHGVWMDNNNQHPLEKKLKLGMNQALVLSDLYADNLGCLYRDASVKRMFNKFVDKKVVATGIFDCCFSGRISQVPEITVHNPYQFLSPDFPERSISFTEVLTAFEQNNDAAQLMQSEDKDVFVSNVFADSIADARAFNLKDNLTISDPAFVVRPSERPGSMFLSLSGTNEYQKGMEMKDADGSYHGVFTKALLQTINENPSNISVQDLFNKIRILIKKKEFEQTPMHAQDPNRLSLNLIGISPSNFSNRIQAKYIAPSGNYYLLDAGKADGLALGNILSLNGNTNAVQLSVVALEPHIAKTQLVKGTASQIGKNGLFIRTDNFTKTAPLLKLYLHLQPVAAAVYKKNMDQTIIPLLQSGGYRNYFNWYATETSRYIFLNKTGFAANNHLLADVSRYPSFFIFLPLPENVLKAFKQKLRLDQNYELVDDPSKAQLVLYLNYTNEESGGYVFSWAPPLLEQGGTPAFYSQYVKTSQLPVNSREIAALTNELYEMTSRLAQQYTGVWMNDHPKKKL